MPDVTFVLEEVFETALLLSFEVSCDVILLETEGSLDEPVDTLSLTADLLSASVSLKEVLELVSFDEQEVKVSKRIKEIIIAVIFLVF